MSNTSRTDATVNFLSDEAQRDLISIAQDVPFDPETETYGTTPAADRALTELVNRFQPVIKAAAKSTKLATSDALDEAESIALVAFMEAVRKYDLTSDKPFSAYIKTILVRAINDNDRTDYTIQVKETVAAQYWRLIRKHGGLAAGEDAVRAAYQECRTTNNNFDAATFLSAHRAITGGGSLSAMQDADAEGASNSVYEEYLVDATSDIEADLARTDYVRWLFTQLDDVKKEAILRLYFGFEDITTENARWANGYKVGEELSDKQIAGVLGMTTPTVNRRRNAAVESMREAAMTDIGFYEGL